MSAVIIICQKVIIQNLVVLRINAHCLNMLLLLPPKMIRMTWPNMHRWRMSTVLMVLLAPFPIRICSIIRMIHRPASRPKCVIVARKVAKVSIENEHGKCKYNLTNFECNLMWPCNKITIFYRIFGVRQRVKFVGMQESRWLRWILQDESQGSDTQAYSQEAHRHSRATAENSIRHVRQPARDPIALPKNEDRAKTRIHWQRWMFNFSFMIALNWQLNICFLLLSWFRRRTRRRVKHWRIIATRQ